MPSQIVYDLLNDLIDPAHVRQDHLFMSRATDAQGRVTGATWHDAKIGRDVDGRIVLFPDPMGATGSSLISAMEHYRTRLEGQPREYLRRAAHWSFVAAAALCVVTAVLGTMVAAFKTF